MWPWEHAIIGYLAYSLFCHLYYRDSPTGFEAIAAVFASVLPDIIDKPLAWEYGFFETGYALGHSIFFAIPLALVIGWLARSVEQTRIGIAFGIGYLLHSPSDILHHYATSQKIQYELMLWPLAPVGSYEYPPGFVEYSMSLFGRYQNQVLVADFSIYIWIQAGVAVLTFLLWLYDGAPIVRECFHGGKQIIFRMVNIVGF
ncbi:metal-dependent hydrolase [Natrialba sp. SSL1]|uniref:metal-dependent hydrolase n=1 Tax=Natrialba sp. SSL1 TaxID=1869245 RepID=UPI0008F8D84A|nr:metal-dependent hydrolase [Natrialba sp. SSL1]OIB57354.1 hydrolase [Natrialba sp. SSL1]